MSIRVRDYSPSDEPSWLRCRALSFLNTAYYDDVLAAKPRGAAVELVAEVDDAIVGVLDLSVDQDMATIDTVGVHPDYQRHGIGSDLLEHALVRATSAGATCLDAWTRDDDQALRWYARHGFIEDSHYLHVHANHYANPAEPARAVDARSGRQPIGVFLHAPLEREEEMRRTFRCVYVCRWLVRDI